MSSQPRVLSGIQPTGAGKHLGNFLGAVRHWAGMQDENECFFFLADLHALTVTPEPAVLRQQIRKGEAIPITLTFERKDAPPFSMEFVAFAFAPNAMSGIHAHHQH